MMDLKKERQEALDAARYALAKLKTARESLSDARGWGVCDTFFRGGLISGMVKHSRMNDASDSVSQAKAALQSLNRELQDLSLDGINLETGDMLGFADIFLDGFISDIFMQGRIKDACDQVDRAISSVSDLISRLENPKL